MKKYLPAIALLLASNVGAAEEMLDTSEAIQAQIAIKIEAAHEVSAPSMALSEQAEMLAQQKMNDAMQRMDDQISRDMGEQLNDRYAFSD